MLPFIQAYREGLYNWTSIKANVFSGLIMALIGLPMAMSMAIASGFRPEQGVYTTIFSTLAVALFGGTLTQIVGPVGSLIGILIAFGAQYGMNGLQIATIMAGIMLCVMGWLRLGILVKFIPYPVIVGFTAGIAVTLWVSQAKSFFGLAVPIPLDAPIYEKIRIILAGLPELDMTTTAFGVGTMLLLLFLPRALKSVPAAFVALVLATVLQLVFKFESVETIYSVFGEIPSHFPRIQWPSLANVDFIELMGPAFTIAMLCSIGSLLSASAVDAITGHKHNSNQELVGQGLGNIISPLMSGFAGSAAIARTAAGVRLGASSPIASITHAFTLLGMLMALSSSVMYMPLAAPAAIIFVIAYSMADVPEIMTIIKRGPRQDVLIMGMACVLTVFGNLVVAVAGSTALAMLLFMAKTYQSVEVNLQKKGQLGRSALDSKQYSKFLSDGLIYSIDGPFFFGVAEKVERALGATHTDPKFVVFRLGNIPFIDLSGLETFAGVVAQYRKRKVRVFICEANAQVSADLVAAGVLTKVEGKAVFGSLKDVADWYVR